MSPFLLTTLAVAASAAAIGPASAAGGRTRLPAPWTSRVLLVCTPDAADPRVDRQRRTFAAMGAAARERDLVLVEAIGATPDAEALRRRFDIDGAVFTTALIGKDGGIKLRSSHVLGPGDLFPTIDAMPMRRQEMAR